MMHQQQRLYQQQYQQTRNQHNSGLYQQQYQQR
jgi:hypothetical protein